MDVLAHWRGEKLWKMEQEEEHGHGHHEHDETRIIDTGHGSVELSIFEEGQPPHWRLRTLSGRKWEASNISVATRRGTGTYSQVFDFVEKDGFMESVTAIPEPHSFDVRLSLGHRGHVHDYDVEFREHEHGHDHDHSALEGLDVNSREYRDAHEKPMLTTSKTFCQSQRNHRADYPVWANRWTHSLPGGHHRSAAVHP